MTIHLERINVDVSVDISAVIGYQESQNTIGRINSDHNENYYEDHIIPEGFENNRNLNIKRKKSRTFYSSYNTGTQPSSNNERQRNSFHLKAKR